MGQKSSFPGVQLHIRHIFDAYFFKEAKQFGLCAAYCMVCELHRSHFVYPSLEVSSLQVNRVDGGDFVVY